MTREDLDRQAIIMYRLAREIQREVEAGRQPSKETWGEFNTARLNYVHSLAYEEDEEAAAHLFGRSRASDILTEEMVMAHKRDGYLITLTEAAARSGRATQTLNNLILRGSLQAWPDPERPGHQLVGAVEIAALGPKKKTQKKEQKV